MDARRVIEALRCGVPNAQAVEALGCQQPNVASEFDQLFELEQDVPAGLMITGGFGSGKSHTLEFLQQHSLQKNVLCSRVTINKETPLYDPLKLFRAASESAVVPGRCGNGIGEIARRIDFKGKRYRELREWALSPKSQIDSRYAASLIIFESAKTDAEAKDRIIQFWAGDPLGVSYVKECLRRFGLPAIAEFRTLKQRDFALQRFQFVSRLVLAAGYQGWVILIDEVELIGRYSQLQRAKSYAELARLRGDLPSFTCPRLTVVFALTDDFDSKVISEKGDWDEVTRLSAMYRIPNASEVASLAILGMRSIRQPGIRLRLLPELQLRQLYATVKQLHAAAYSWSPPDAMWPEQRTTTSMRHYIKTWIIEWDMKRLYPNEESVVEQIDVNTDYSESKDQDSGGLEEVDSRSTIDEILDRLL